MSTPPSSLSRPALIHEVSAALRRRDRQFAEALLAEGATKPGELVAAAELAMQQMQWSDAAWLFDRLPQPDNTSSIKRCLCRNLASLQKHRPAIYERLISLPTSDHCRIGTSATGQPTIVSRTADGRNLALSPGNRPLDGLAAALRLLQPVMASGQSFALCGLGDGYLFHQVAQKPPKLYLDMQQPVFLLEPDAHVVLTALMFHDYSGENGAIEQERIQWFVGSNWAKQVREVLLNDLFLTYPTISLTMGLTAAEVQKTLAGIIDELTALDLRLRQKLEGYYATLDPAELAAVFGDDPPRQPRVLFLTTRFSTVLQFSTQDTAAGFRSAGWETRVLIEPTRHHRILSIATRAMLAEFKPDLVFQIDHHRFEHPGMFPANLPFVCWIQDHLGHLMTPEAGSRIGVSDFVLTDAGSVYTANYRYPQRQLIAVSKLTAPPPLLPRSTVHGDDLVYVSNNSRTTQAMLDTLLMEAEGNQAEQALMNECWRRLIAMYGRGDCLANYRDVDTFVREIAGEIGVVISDARLTELARAVNHPVCDALYRHQALRWIAEAAEETGLTLALYGQGWDQHPDFARFARGPVAAGRENYELIRRSAINFQIAPYLCLHQRLLDGICCGGFFLVREHISAKVPSAMLDLLETYCSQDVRQLTDARACVPSPVRDRFERLVKECRRCLCFSANEDPIAAVRTFQDAKLLVPSHGVLPRLEEVSFGDAASLKNRIARFVGDADLREEITHQQRENIAGRLSYGATMQRVARQIGALLPRAADSHPAIPKLATIGKAA